MGEKLYRKPYLTHGWSEGTRHQVVYRLHGLFNLERCLNDFLPGNGVSLPKTMSYFEFRNSALKEYLE